MKQITVNGHTYNSISQAWRALSPADLPMITVRWRLNNGWETFLAFKMPAILPTQRRNFKDLRSQ